VDETRSALLCSKTTTSASRVTDPIELCVRSSAATDPADGVADTS